MDKSPSNSGIGFFGLLGIAFIALKLCHIINWSWVWVLYPMWIGFVIALIVVTIIALFKK